MREVIIGGCRLIHGDCLDVLPTLEPGSVDMIWTDPPFGHGNQDGDLQATRVRDGVKGARVKMSEPIQADSGEAFETTLRGFLDNAALILNRDCCCCCCMAGGGPNVTFAKVSQWVDERLAFFMAVVWDKSGRGNGMGWRYRRNYEFVLVSHRKGGRLLWADDNTAVPNIIRDMPVGDRAHPNEKPVSLVRRFLDWHTSPGDFVCDPFMGSGTTGVACVQTGRKFIGIEIDERYFNIAVKRISEAEGVGGLFPPKEDRPDLFAEAK